MSGVVNSKSIWQAPYRPLFFLAGLWALVVPLVWILPEEIALERTSWHSSELLFGMAGAAVGGYLLTVLPAWTKRGPVPPAVTIIASSLWCTARLTAAFSMHFPHLASVIGASAYFVFLAAVLAVALLKAAAWHRLWAPLGAAALGISAALSNVYGLNSIGSPWGIYSLLITAIGGRAVPAFTRHWLVRTGTQTPFRDRPAFSYLAILGILAAICIRGAIQNISGYLLMLSGAVLLLQMASWQSLKAARYPALFILHIAFAWMPAALILNGVAIIFPAQFPPIAALHAMTMGAMGTMIAAFMMRSASVRNGERLILSWPTTCAFRLLSVSALLRVFGDGMSAAYFEPVVAAAVCWMAAWALFMMVFVQAMSRPVPRPVFSAASRNQAYGKRESDVRPYLQNTANRCAVGRPIKEA
ncbi:short-chain dehydrogenase [Ensifer sp. Root142]|nr:short-chain dehydrogenase [Ensifer sp. Root142]